MPTSYENKQILLPNSKCPCLIANFNSPLAIIITHPWGPLGGNMKNNVVSAICIYFQRLHVTTMRFNFVGNQIGWGYREVNQVIEAANYLLNGSHLNHNTNTNNNNNSHNNNPSMKKSPTCILLVGYSYGSLISASSSAKIPQCIGYISIAPPWGVQHWLLLFRSNYHMIQSKLRHSLPRLFVLGSEDNFTSISTFQTIMQSYNSNNNDNDDDDDDEEGDDADEAATTTTTTTAVATGAIVRHVDHFFHGRERDLMNIIAKWLQMTYSSLLKNDLSQLGKVDFSDFIIIDDDDVDVGKNSNKNRSSSSSRKKGQRFIVGLYDCGVLEASSSSLSLSSPCQTTTGEGRKGGSGDEY